jgi:hypothetical protein
MGGILGEGGWWVMESGVLSGGRLPHITVESRMMDGSPIAELARQGAQNGLAPGTEVT